MVVDERRSWKPKERLAVASLLRDQAHPVVTAVGHAAARGSAPGDVLETLAALGEAGVPAAAFLAASVDVSRRRIYEFARVDLCRFIDGAASSLRIAD